jgi:hypothetical protein
MNDRFFRYFTLKSVGEGVPMQRLALPEWQQLIYYGTQLRAPAGRKHAHAQ